MKNEKAILLISCLDKGGIVAEISHFISTYNGNIIHSDQHNDDASNTFFMRIEWNLSGFTIPKDKISQAFEAIAIKFDMKWELKFSSERTKMAIFVSKYDHCLYELLLRNRAGELDADIVQIISNHEDARPIADYFGVPYEVFKITKDTKLDQEQKEIELLESRETDLVVLARYMQVLSPEFEARFRNRIINIHHSFLPAFIGAKPYHQAYTRGVKIIGATCHYVTQELDQGPIIEQDVTRISHRDTVEDLVAKGKNLEKLVLTQGVKLHLEHKVHVYGNKTVVFD
ncbi:MAG: formyltetrahydrofolate deformylase [Spirochaetales bacterium]|uniref:Formyltetrahydrofolate deformylase n=1 Tax=Candidatus Thalassospirochaeta sargassi TaxID=3119039 RepID=A0AAJ1IG63_9SPIO|nr:formyltetrahydrofolate deformylase [Spirochaetales bacterium]